MASYNSYSQVEQLLLNMPKFSEVGGRAAHFALDQIREFSAAIGNHHLDFQSVHVAGTNGKGTVCAMLAAVLSKAGYKTGLYTSPHLNDVRERFRIDNQLISQSHILEFFNSYDDVIKQYPVTFFELTTAIAFWYFSREKVDIAIIETGLGGRLDATNILLPEVSVITSVGIDHTEQLGSTIPEIAREKAGILKHGRPYVTGPLCEQAQLVVDTVAVKKGCRRVTVADSMSIYPLTESLRNCPKPFWKTNIQMCTEVLMALNERFLVDSDQFSEGLTLVCSDGLIKGRFERLNPDLPIYFDGAHNMEALRATIIHAAQFQQYKSIAVVVSLMKDKLDLLENDLFDSCDELFYFPMTVPRAADFHTFCSKFPAAKHFNGDTEGIQRVCDLAKSKLVLFTGSFYFYSIVSEWMESIAPVPKTN